MTQKQRFDFVINHFLEHQPNAETELLYDNPFQLLVAVILSAQCTDKRVNMVVPHLFSQFPTPKDLAEASIEEIFSLIKSISYPNNKAKHLSAMAQRLVNNFGGEVPDTVQELETLQGVGRKTANVVASVIFNQPRMAVDTHVFRVSNRLGLTKKSKNPLQTEKTLVKYIPKQHIATAHHWLILHGRYVCMARKPKCEVCALQAVCQYYKEQSTKSNQ